MKYILILYFAFCCSLIGFAQQGKEISTQHSDSKAPGDDLKKRLDELEKRTKEAEQKAIDAEKKAADAEKKATEADKRAAELEKKSKSSAISSPIVSPSSSSSSSNASKDEVKYVKGADGKMIKMVNGKVVKDGESIAAPAPQQTNVMPSKDEVKYVKGADGKMIKMVNGKIVKDGESVASPTPGPTSTVTGDVKYVKGPDGKMIKMVNGKVVKDDVANAPASTTTGGVKASSVSNTEKVATSAPPKPIAPDIGKVTKLPTTSSPSSNSPVTAPAQSTESAPTAPTVAARKVDTSRPSILTITADSECSLKVGGKDLPVLKPGTPYTYKSHWGEIPVEAYLVDKSDKVVEKIFVDADKFSYNIRFVRPEKLFKFINENKVEMVKELLKNNPAIVNPKDEFDFSPLALACEKGKPEIVKAILDAGADVKLAGNSQCLLNACMSGNSEIAKMLIEKGMDVNQKFENGWTILHHATQKGKMEVISILLENGVDVEAKNDKGETAKDIAYENGMIDLARMLIKK